MTIEEIYENARRKLDKSEITIGEFAEIVGREVYDPCEDTISRQQAIDVVKGIDRSFVKYIEELPSAQPDIIRCKDCKYWMRAYLSISGKHGCNVMRDYTAPDDYCFKAERDEE